MERAYCAVQVQCGNLSEKGYTRNSSRNACPQSSQCPEPLWTDPSLKNGIGMHKLISTKKFFLKVQVGNDLSNLPPQILACK